jgi:hypothetical protein
VIELGQGFPEWTELGQDSGLDPLGMQRPIEAIYQSLLPGVSTITLRFRYYSFFPWILKHYEDHIRHTDPAIFPPPSGDEHSGSANRAAIAVAERIL